MARPQMLLMQFYRQEPGDLGIQDIPAPDDERLEETLSAGLVGHYKGNKTEKVPDPTKV
jgi:hypothetical protein